MKEKFSHIVRNDSLEPLRLYLEPWGEEYTIQPGAELTFSVSGNPSPPCLETEFTSDHISLYGPTGSVVQAYHGSNPVESGYKAFPIPK